MRLITEEVVKKILKAGKLVRNGTLTLPADCLLTPSAKATVVDYKLSLVQEGASTAAARSPHAGGGARSHAGSGARGHAEGGTASKAGGEAEGSTPGGALGGAPGGALGSAPGGAPGGTPGKEGRYRLPDGSTTSVKPEHLTQLSGTQLVAKDDARIRLRGEVDLLAAELLKAQLRVAACGSEHSGRLIDELQEVYDYLGKLSRAEVLDEPFSVETIIGLAYADLREVSHHPRRYFGREHLFSISYLEGELTVLLNALRAQARRAELVFYEAFKRADGSVARPDLMEGYNRLSSVLYILCLRAATKVYGGKQ